MYKGSIPKYTPIIPVKGDETIIVKEKVKFLFNICLSLSLNKKLELLSCSLSNTPLVDGSYSLLEVVVESFCTHTMKIFKYKRMNFLNSIMDHLSGKNGYFKQNGMV
jgi:hypothetical protein